MRIPFKVIQSNSTKRSSGEQLKKSLIKEAMQCYFYSTLYCTFFAKEMVLLDYTSFLCSASCCYFMCVCYINKRKAWHPESCVVIILCFLSFGPLQVKAQSLKKEASFPFSPPDNTLIFF